MLGTNSPKVKFINARRWAGAIGLVVLMVVVLAACQSTAPAATQPPTATKPPATSTPESVVLPAVTVADQPIKEGAVSIAEVVSDGQGWLVIHAQAEGKPGPILGYAQVSNGENQNVVVDIDASQASETLYAMLHTDAGQVGEYEFPGEDAPVKVNDQVVTPAFKLVGGSDTQPSSETDPGTVFIIVPDKSQVSYEVGETFLNQDNRFNLAIGRTGQIEGEIFVNRDDPQQSSIGSIQVDISQFTSDSSRRDGALRDRFLQSAQYPIATFEPTQIEGLPESYNDGEQSSFKVSGDLTVREVTKPVTFDVTMRLDGDTLTGEASTIILMSDFEVGPISIAGILNTEDEIKLTFTFIAQP